MLLRKKRRKSKDEAESKTNSRKLLANNNNFSAYIKSKRWQLFLSSINSKGTRRALKGKPQIAPKKRHAPITEKRKEKNQCLLFCRSSKTLSPPPLFSSLQSALSPLPQLVLPYLARVNRKYYCKRFLPVVF